MNVGKYDYEDLIICFIEGKLLFFLGKGEGLSCIRVFIRFFDLVISVYCLGIRTLFILWLFFCVFEFRGRYM